MASISKGRRVYLRELVVKLGEKYPVFKTRKNVVPLKIGLKDDLKAAEPDLTEKDLCDLFTHYCWLYHYKLALTTNPTRYDLYMNEAGTVDEVIKVRSQKLLDERYTVRKEKKPKTPPPPPKPKPVAKKPAPKVKGKPGKQIKPVKDNRPPLDLRVKFENKARPVVAVQIKRRVVEVPKELPKSVDRGPTPNQMRPKLTLKSRKPE